MKAPHSCRLKMILFAAAALLLTCIVGISQARTWHSGTYTLDGDFVELMPDGETVRVKQDSDGEVKRLKMKYLSKADKAYVRACEAKLGLFGVPRELRFALLIGVNEYTKEPLLAKLPSCVKDMTDLRDAFGQRTSH